MCLPLLFCLLYLRGAHFVCFWYLFFYLYKNEETYFISFPLGLIIIYLIRGFRSSFPIVHLLHCSSFNSFVYIFQLAFTFFHILKSRGHDEENKLPGVDVEHFDIPLFVFHYAKEYFRLYFIWGGHTTSFAVVFSATSSYVFTTLIPILFAI